MIIKIKLICIYFYFPSVFTKMYVFCNCLFISTFSCQSIKMTRNPYNHATVHLFNLYIYIDINTCNKLYFISFSKHPLLPMRPSLNPTSAQIISPFTSSESISVRCTVNWNMHLSTKISFTTIATNEFTHACTKTVWPSNTKGRTFTHVVAC